MQQTYMTSGQFAGRVILCPLASCVLSSLLRSSGYGGPPEDQNNNVIVTYCVVIMSYRTTPQAYA